MNSIFSKIITAVICIVTVLSLAVVPVSAGQEDELIDQINKLEQQIKDKDKEINAIKADKNEQQKIKNLYDQKMALYQSQINICNNKIRETNEKIAENEAEIVKKEEEMESVIRDFKKRMSSIYMNGSTGSGIELLLGADDFSDFLALSQLTANISRHDKKMMRDIEDMIKSINLRTEENKKLIEEQNEIKKTLDVKRAEYDALASEVQKEIDALNAEQKDVQSDKNQLQADLKAKEDYLNALLNPGEVYKGYFDGTFAWPVPGYLGTTSGYGERWGTMHKGIDIASSGIRGKPIIASASGEVVSTYTACPHNYGKKSSCYNSSGKRCGGGYGNNVVIQHGKSGSYYYQTLYGHMQSVTVKAGQYVTQGQVIGYVGSTGYSTGWHLHFEIHLSTNGVNFSHTNPELYVKKTK